jgi:spermidine synthase
VKGAASLYTEEFFQMAKDHLKPGGVVTQFVQLYESTEEAVKSEIATFFKVFPNAIVWANTINGQGYDLVLFGQVEETKIDVDEWNARLASPDYNEMAKSLSEINVLDGTALLSTFAGLKSDLDPWMKDAKINTDRNLKLQYLAGMGLNLYSAENILANMTQTVKYPERLFTGSPIHLDTLRGAIKPSIR